MGSSSRVPLLRARSAAALVLLGMLLLLLPGPSELLLALTTHGDGRMLGLEVAPLLHKKTAV